MKEENKSGGIFEALGEMIGYLCALPFSVIGLGLIIWALVIGGELVRHEKIIADSSMVGSGLTVAGAFIAGAVMLASKQFRR